MEIMSSVAIVTGAGRGIGAAIAHSLAAAGARVVVSDLDGAAARSAAAEINVVRPGTALAVPGDCADHKALTELIAATEQHFGPVDIFCANAGIAGGRGLDASDAEWAEALDVNVLSHVRAARLLMPGWLERGRGYFVSTASAAGLLTQLGSAPYSLTKHAAVAFAEWLAITYGDRGIKVSCLCPMGVRTALLDEPADGDVNGRLALAAVTESGVVLDPAAVGRLVVEALGDERFLILPHPEVLTYWQSKTGDYERWISGMRQYQARLLG
jgi:NAD(P)-dependent dehydrogenase (short-subunit alcohol dehydrogenase family)